jgi:hypothetical protein
LTNEEDPMKNDDAQNDKPNPEPPVPSRYRWSEPPEIPSTVRCPKCGREHLGWHYCSAR